MSAEVPHGLPIKIIDEGWPDQHAIYCRDIDCADPDALHIQLGEDGPWEPFARRV